MLGEDKGIDAVPHNFIRIMAGPAGLSIHPLFSGYSFQGKKHLFVFLDTDRASKLNVANKILNYLEENLKEMVVSSIWLFF